MASNKKLNNRAIIVSVAIISVAIFIFYPRETVRLANSYHQTLESQLCYGPNTEHFNAISITYRGIPSINSRIYNDPCENNSRNIYWARVFDDAIIGALVGGLLVLAPILIATNRSAKTVN